MDLVNLRTFASVAEEGSFAKAAQSLHVTQPAVSKRIALLEESLGVALFDRLGRHTELTEAGRALLGRVPDVEQSLRRAEQAVRDLAGEVSGPLRLATSHHIGLHRLPPVLSAFRQQHPAVELAIEFLDSEQAYERLRSGDIELAVVTLATGDVSRLISEGLWIDSLRPMVAPKHPLATRGNLRLEHLAEYPAVLPGLETFTGQIVRRHFSAAGLTLRLSMSTNYLETLRMMATVGLGWTVLPDFMAGNELRCLTLPRTSMQRTLGLVLREGRSLSRSATSFAEMLRKTARESRDGTAARARRRGSRAR